MIAENREGKTKSFVTTPTEVKYCVRPPFSQELYLNIASDVVSKNKHVFLFLFLIIRHGKYIYTSIYTSIAILAYQTTDPNIGS